MQNADLILWATVVQALSTTVMTFIIVAQIRHMRAGNQAKVIVSIAEQFSQPEVRAADHYVNMQLAADLEVHEHRVGAASVPWSGPTQAAKPLLSFYEELGAVVFSGGLDLVAVERFVFPAVTWERVAPLVAVLRRHDKRGPRYLEMFEALACADRRYTNLHGASRFPRNVPRPKLVDPWAPVDETGVNDETVVEGAHAVQPHAGIECLRALVRGAAMLLRSFRAHQRLRRRRRSTTRMA